MNIQQFLAARGLLAESINADALFGHFISEMEKGLAIGAYFIVSLPSEPFFLPAVCYLYIANYGLKGIMSPFSYRMLCISSDMPCS